ncbi:MAG: type II toxin-antitoxin system HicA family toxin [Pseudomonadota bacterium]
MAGTYYKALTKALSKAGFSYLRAAKGSHEVWQQTQTGRKVIVPHNLKSRHTANAILKSAGIEHKV